jgi:hypothetical protein
VKKSSAILFPLSEKTRIGNFMVSKTILFLTAGLCLIQLPSDLSAQEAVSTTTGSGSAASTSEASGNSPSSTNVSATGGTTATAGGPTVEAAPSGAGVFSRSPVEILATISGGYDNNVNTIFSSQKQGSGYTNGNLTLDYAFGDPRLQLNLNAGAGATYYYQHVGGQDYDIDLKGAIGITYKSSPRLTLGSSLLAEYLTEPSFDYAGGLNSRNGNYFYTADNFFVAYAWTARLSTKTSYTLEAFKYDNNTIGLFSDRVSHTFGNEFRLQVVPTTALIVEYRYGVVSYEHEGDIIGSTLVLFPVLRIVPIPLELDSTTHYVLGGIDHTFNPRLIGSIRGGAEFRSYDNGGKQTGPYFEGTLTYALGRRTSLSWNNRYGLEEPDVPTAQSRTTFRTGLQTKFDLTSRIASTIDLYYVHDEFHPLTAGPITSMAFSENTFDGGISLRYKINPLFGVQVGYHYTDVNSGMASREYSRNRVFGGGSFIF